MTMLNENTTIKLDDLLIHITKNAYDSTHGLLPGMMAEWVVDAPGILDMIAEKLNVSQERLGEYFDVIRHQAHKSAEAERAAEKGTV